ncbi:universal stress protein [Salinadaptatus halalkaliphilus]|uniref:Universal stress protein n=1 Tax=Salinadaptatus halalkaliphilus TaxID=2419781 RepID=A0A4S3TKH6_9EURY|nr:universal stress protein [Salinadaptatus halalkaliphilus]THE63435.1 universal stress protein [Salinadaptatus halalkaliphilus]
MYESVLVATDGSDSADRAVDAALDLASVFDATLYAVSVVDTRRYGDSALSGTEDIVSDLETQANELLDAVEKRADGGVMTELRHGKPHAEISDYATAIDADLLVLGNRGRESGEVIGSTAERIVRFVDRPVLTI